MTIRQIDTSGFLAGIVHTHPSIIEIGGRGYMSYRIEQDPPNRKTRVGVCMCDGDWRADSNTHSFLGLNPETNKEGDAIIEDCRLFDWNGDLGFALTNREKMGYGRLSRNTLAMFDFHWLPLAAKNWT